MAVDPPPEVLLTETQQRVLAALCRPISAGNPATPATDEEIAEAVFLSADAVQGHLRTLYRKFGIADLPQDRRRARLVELAIAGGYVEAPAGEVPVIREDVAAPQPAPPPMTVADEAGEDEGRSLVPYITIAILILVIIGASLATSGIFNQGSSAEKAPTPAAYRQEVAGDCRLALAAAPEAGGGRAERARGYLEAIETLRTRLESLVPPSLPDIALERFTTGLATAVNYTNDVAAAPPAPGSAAEAKDVAELSSAAAQVRAGAVGYRLGRECLAIGDLVARSAQNAAAP